MSRLIPDSYMYRAIGAEINGACGKCSLSRSDCMGQSLSRMDVCGLIDDAPTVDAVPVVRCGDCKHRFVVGENVRFNVCELNHNQVQSDDWFCADGERKE